MTVDRDLERLLDTWLADGPVVVADRVIDDAAARIAHQPQQPAWRLRPWRFPSMTPSARVAVTVMAVVVATCGLLIFRQHATVGPGGGPPTPSPAARPSRSPSASVPVSAVPAGCEDGLPGCAGPLGAGAHGSSHFAPRLIHYVTPAGWTNSIDTSTIYKLDAPASSASILLWADVAIEDQTPTSCDPVAANGNASPQAAVWVTYLASHPGLVTTSSPFDFSGSRDEGTRSLDITMDPTWKQTCPRRTEPEVLFIAHTSPPLGAYGVGGRDRVRLIVLDTTSYGAHTVLVEIYGPLDDAGFADTLRVTEPVLDTFVFGCGPGSGYGPCSGYPKPSP